MTNATVSRVRTTLGDCTREAVAMVQ